MRIMYDQDTTYLVHIEKHINAVRCKLFNSILENGNICVVKLSLLDGLGTCPHRTKSHHIETPLLIEFQSSGIHYLIVVVRSSFNDGIEAMKKSNPAVLISEPMVRD